MKIISGKVVSAKMKNTIVVEVRKQKTDALYKKIIYRTKRYKVHSEKDGINEGDTVQIVQTRPISKEKHYKVYTKSK
jgi:small subunit ribosomal protein S17